MLDGQVFRRPILLGDIFSGPNFRRWRQSTGCFSDISASCRMERRCNAQSIAPTLRLSLPQPATVIDNPFVFISDFGSFSVDSQPIHHPVITNQ